MIKVRKTIEEATTLGGFFLPPPVLARSSFKVALYHLSSLSQSLSSCIPFKLREISITFLFRMRLLILY